MEGREKAGLTAGLQKLTIRVVHDNFRCLEGLRTAWGFAALVEGPRKTILFDTGSDGPLLLENMARLNIDPATVDAVVLSHIHPDHTGGLLGFLDTWPKVEVYAPASFPARFNEALKRRGTGVVAVGGPQAVCLDVETTGQLGRRIKEQALIIKTRRGLAVLTGCAHPGVVNIIETVKRWYDEEILLVMGGFHLEWALQRRIRRIVAFFKQNGVRHVAPTHCSGDRARDLFRREFGARYVDVGVGRTLPLSDLKA
jgi:7,8-dihydropterin-6-yl-methyl-4-(beta-D-ribofuranosyl)aminobenzene 5'-phosphate synthase